MGSKATPHNKGILRNKADMVAIPPKVDMVATRPKVAMGAATHPRATEADMVRHRGSMVGDMGPRRKRVG